MTCAKPRPTKPPFDVQHRHIIFYTQDSPSDFQKLQSEVTSRLKGQLEKTAALQTVASLSAVKTDHGLSPHEIAAMVVMTENRIPGGALTPFGIRKDMRRAGYTDLATTLSLESLVRKGLIELVEINSDDGPYSAYDLTSRGVEWMLENIHRFKLQQEELPGLPVESGGPEIADEDIPF